MRGTARGSLRQRHLLALAWKTLLHRQPFALPLRVHPSKQRIDLLFFAFLLFCFLLWVWSCACICMLCACVFEGGPNGPNGLGPPHGDASSIVDASQMPNIGDPRVFFQRKGGCALRTPGGLALEQEATMWAVACGLWPVAKETHEMASACMIKPKPWEVTTCNCSSPF